ncbi:MAG: hypothetical protein HKL80_07440 [Acidimicrobiales bacterium]|nr:hypothetical protein [Acidimicrobiales bacterium]
MHIFDASTSYDAIVRAVGRDVLVDVLVFPVLVLQEERVRAKASKKVNCEILRANRKASTIFCFAKQLDLI